MGRAVLIVAACALLSCAAATAAATPTAYRAQLNGICRTYTPWFKKEMTTANSAQAAHDMASLAIALGHFERLWLGENARIEATPVPAALSAQMTPIIATLKQVDAHIKKQAARALAGDTASSAKEMNAAFSLASALTARYDAVALRDCGSNQG
jgi:hypothetical protein